MSKGGQFQDYIINCPVLIEVDTRFFLIALSLFALLLYILDQKRLTHFRAIRTIAYFSCPPSPLSLSPTNALPSGQIIYLPLNPTSLYLRIAWIRAVSFSAVRNFALFCCFGQLRYVVLPFCTTHYQSDGTKKSVRSHLLLLHSFFPWRAFKCCLLPDNTVGHEPSAPPTLAVPLQVLQ